MIAKIYVTLKKDVSDPQGFAVKGGLESLGFDNVNKVHVGKFFVLELEDSPREEAENSVREMCNKLLANPVIEDFTFTIENGEES